MLHKLDSYCNIQIDWSVVTPVHINLFVIVECVLSASVILKQDAICIGWSLVLFVDVSVYKLIFLQLLLSCYATFPKFVLQIRVFRKLENIRIHYW